MLRFETPEGDAVEIAPRRLIIAGWTGRDPEKIAEHIAELAEIGVPGPSTTPVYYEAPPALAARIDTLDALGGQTGGEAEAVLLDDGARLWIGLGSDHTDRDLEATCVARSKAVVAKPLAGAVWPFDAVADRLDGLRIVSEASDDGETWTPYQSGTLDGLLPPSALIDGAPELDAGSGGASRLGAGALLFCGALPASGGVRPTPWFRARLEDPVLGRALSLSYRVRTLPIRR